MRRTLTDLKSLTVGSMDTDEYQFDYYHTTRSNFLPSMFEFISTHHINTDIKSRDCHPPLFDLIHKSLLYKSEILRFGRVIIV